MSADRLVSLLLTDLTAIAVLVIASLGLAVIFGMMRVINLAHGEFIMTGAYAALVVTRLGLPLWLAATLAAIFGAGLGAVVEVVVIRRLYGRLLDSLLATWGLSLVLSQSAVILFGPATTGIEPPLGSFKIGRYSISEYSLVLMAVAAALVLAVYLLMTRTSYGLRARAAIQDPDMASCLGINSARVNMATFAAGSSLACLAGALLAPVYSVTPTLGLEFVASTFLTVVVAGPVVLSGLVLAATLLATVRTAVAYASTAVIGQAALLIAAILLLRFFKLGISGNWKKRL